ncbi:PREDICTED: N-acetyltransferase 9 [Nanorana parkeri]|uniref:N-acetyltransferase 9 n=1 Tax=Nanorana parkeri TaxID=125878 RepID=UPI0008547140|nr:PREDICTED: N-acetyltransferase 9 [Nanorana parkeri]
MEDIQGTAEPECTFIILDAAKWDQGCPEEACMVGDVNLFIVDPKNPSLAEIEIMIAEPESRGRGFGEESVRLMLFYGVSFLGMSTFQAKIGHENIQSIRLFEKFNFQEVSFSSVFQELTLQWKVTEEEGQLLLNTGVMKPSQCHPYEHAPDLAHSLMCQPPTGIAEAPDCKLLHVLVI